MSFTSRNDPYLVWKHEGGFQAAEHMHLYQNLHNHPVLWRCKELVWKYLRTFAKLFTDVLTICSWNILWMTASCQILSVIAHLLVTVRKTSAWQAYLKAGTLQNAIFCNDSGSRHGVTYLLFKRTTTKTPYYNSSKPNLYATISLHSPLQRAVCPSLVFIPSCSLNLSTVLFAAYKKHGAGLGPATVQTRDAQVGESRALYVNWLVGTTVLLSLPLAEMPQRRWRHPEGGGEGRAAEPQLFPELYLQAVLPEGCGYVCIQAMDLLFSLWIDWQKSH